MWGLLTWRFRGQASRGPKWPTGMAIKLINILQTCTVFLYLPVPLDFIGSEKLNVSHDKLVNKHKCKVQQCIVPNSYTSHMKMWNFFKAGQKEVSSRCHWVMNDRRMIPNWCHTDDINTSPKPIHIHPYWIPLVQIGFYWLSWVQLLDLALFVLLN